MSVAHHHVEQGGHHRVATRYRHDKSKRPAPRGILLNPRNAGHRPGSHRGDYLRIAPTENLAGGAAQPDNAAALRGSEAGAGERDGRSGDSRSWADARELKCVHRKRNPGTHDAILQEPGRYQKPPERSTMQPPRGDGEGWQSICPHCSSSFRYSTRRVAASDSGLPLRPSPTVRIPKSRFSTPATPFPRPDPLPAVPPATY